MGTARDAAIELRSSLTKVLKMENTKRDATPQQQFVVLPNLAANNLDPHFTETQLAKRWNKSVKTLQADRWKGTGVSFLKLGRSVRYRLSDIVAYESSHTVVGEVL